MSFIAVAILGSAAIGAGASIYGSVTQAGAEASAQQGLINQENQTQNSIMKLLQPYATAGQTAIPTLESLLTPGPNQTATLSQLPGFQFAQDWGLKGVQNVQSTRGLGGNALAGGAQFATGLAQQSFGGLAGLLQNFANMGSGAAGTAAGQLAGTAQAFAPAIAGTTIGQANALAGGATGAAGALGGGVNNLALLGALGVGPFANAGAGQYGNTGLTQNEAFNAIRTTPYR